MIYRGEKRDTDQEDVKGWGWKRREKETWVNRKRLCATLRGRICAQDLEQPSAEWWIGLQDGPVQLAQNRTPLQARLVQQEGAGGPWGRQVVLGQASGNTTQTGSGPVIQARQLIAFQGVSQNCVLKDQPTTFPFDLEGLAVRS